MPSSLTPARYRRRVHACTHSRVASPASPPGTTARHELRLHRRTGRAAQDRPRVPRRQEPRGRRARADGDRDRVRPGRVVADGRAAGPAGPARSPRSSAARATATSSSASCSRRWAARCCARRSSPPSCSPRNTLLHSGDDAAKKAYLPGIASGETIATLAFTEPSGKWDESGITHGGHRLGRRLHAHRHEDVRARRPHRQPDHRRRQDRQGRQPVRRRRRRRGPHPHDAVDDGPDPQAGQARVRRHAGHAASAPRARAGTTLSHACSTSPPSASPPSRSAAPRRCSTWPSSTPRSACSSAARSARSRRSSTSAPTCCSRSSRPSPPRTTACGAPRR